jgi:hypothetical protein
METKRLQEIDFDVSYFQMSVTIFIERAFEKLYLKKPKKYFSLEEFIKLINFQNLAPFWLNDNQIKIVIIKMNDLGIIESKGGKYRFKQIDFTALNEFIKD